MKKARGSLKSFALWGIILIVAATALIIAFLLLFLPRISAQEQDYSLVSCPLKNGAPAGSIYYKSASLRYFSVAADDSYRNRYPEGSLYRYYFERADGLKFYLILNLSVSAEEPISGKRQLNIRGETILPQELKGKKYSPGSLRLNILGSSGEKLAVLDFGELSGGKIGSRQYSLTSKTGTPRFIAEYSYPDSDIYGASSYNCRLEDLIYLD